MRTLFCYVLYMASFFCVICSLLWGSDASILVTLGCFVFAIMGLALDMLGDVDIRIERRGKV